MKKAKSKKVETSVSETKVGVVTKEDLEDAKKVVTEANAKKDLAQKTDAEVKAKQYQSSVKSKIKEAIAAAKAGVVGSCSIKIDKDFDEATAALFVPSLEEQGHQVEFLDKRGADYRIMAISW